MIQNNSKKVLLIMQSPVNKTNYLNTLPPLGILYISSFLESKGMITKVIDYNVSNNHYSVVYDYDLICFSVNCGNITNTLNMARAVKEKYNKEIIVGGPQVTSDPEFFINKEYIDGAVVGEGEHTLYEYIKNRKSVQGIYLKDRDKKIIFGGERPYIKDLDALPFPAFDKIDIKKYNLASRKRKPTSVITTSRGCPFNCIFCFHSIGYLYRKRSVKNIIEEIEWQVNNFGVREICFLDDNISLDIDRAKKIFNAIIDRDIDVVFQLFNGISADRVDEELLRSMKKAKVWYISIAPESGNSESIRLLRKGFDNEAVKRVVKMSKDMGFFTYSNFLIGLPWETEEDIRKTIDFAAELDTDLGQFARITAFPKTELYSMCNLNYKIDRDIGLFYGDSQLNISKLSDAKLDKLAKEAYRRCYLKPKKAMRLLKTLTWRGVYLLIKYSITTLRIFNGWS